MMLIADSAIVAIISPKFNLVFMTLSVLNMRLMKIAICTTQLLIALLYSDLFADWISSNIRHPVDCTETKTMHQSELLIFSAVTIIHKSQENFHLMHIAQA